MAAEANSAMQTGVIPYNSYADTHSRSHAGSNARNYWRLLAENAILILGSPRSGTSWLAKIFDSHPNVLYRHEPDEVVGFNSTLHPVDQIALWLHERGLRVAAKRPHFQKDWRPHLLSASRNGIAAAVAATQRLPGFRASASRLPIPDLVFPPRRGTVRAALKLVNWDGLAAARSMTDVRCVFIVRHPCAQIASVMAGRAAQRFANYQTPSGLDLAGPTDPTAILRASAAGVSAKAFAKLPEAARLAWSWVAFNEPALTGFEQQPNAQIILYEDLCREPQATARTLFSFAALPWHPQTEAFVDQSTSQDRGAGYYDVFRAGAGVADKWRRTMSEEDQKSVWSVVACSPLVSLWPDWT